MKPTLQPSDALHHFLLFAWENSPFYRRLYQEHGIQYSDLEHVNLPDLPIITKQIVLENFDEVVTDRRIHNAALEQWLEYDHDPRSRFLGKFLVMHSSASSYSTKSSIVYDEASWRRITATAAVYLYPNQPPRTTRYRSAFYIGEHGHLASATTALNSSPTAFDSLIVTMTDPVQEMISQLNAFQPDRLTSYSSSLGWLAELQLDGKLKIFPRDVVVSSDRLTPAVEARIRQAWNPKLYDLYASVEALFMAVKQPGQAEWKVLEELLRIEVLDAKDRQVGEGEMGRAVLTHWANRTLPLIRYDLTDYVICGETQAGKATLRGFAGRSFEALPIRLEDGRTGEIPSYVLSNFNVTGLEALQFVSHSPDEVEVHYCARQPMDEVLQNRMADLMEKWGGARTKFRLQRVQHLWNNAVSFKLKLVRTPDEPQIGLPAHILSPDLAERQDEKLRPGGGFTPFRRQQLEESLAAVFERQVERTPEATAVKDGALRLTYAELNRAANRAAHTLRLRQMDAAHPVALLFQHRAAMISAMLGALKAGGWYAPLDPAHPARRNTAILHEIAAGLALTDGEGVAIARSYGFTDEQILNVDELAAAVESGYLAGNLRLNILPGAPACLLYTSGSTGQPKGVVLDQRAVLHRAMLYTNDYAIGPSDRMALLQSYVFNASVREIYAALLNGAGLYLYSIQREGVHHLGGWLEAEGITTLYMAPATFRVFLDTLQGEQFERLRLIRLGGEAVLRRDVEGFQRHFGPGCLLANGLASTETGTICQYFINHRTRVAGSGAPVGFAVLDKEVSLLDEDGRPVEDGAVGEIVAASLYMGPGYFTPPGAGVEAALNGEAGVASGLAGGLASGIPGVVHTGDLGYRLPDGRIVLVGRKDWQVKLRGQRMNLLEIEQALLALENVAEAAVTLPADEAGAAFLAAYIQPKAQPWPTEAALRQGLRTLLPEVMVPAVFLFFAELPRTVSGKVDRQALPAAPRGPVEDGSATSGSTAVRQAPAASETPTEQALAEIWRELLGIETVKANDNFFDLGGDSLVASTLMARIEAKFKRKFPLSLLVQHETLGELAKKIAAEEAARPQGPLITIQPLGDKAPVFFIPGIGGEVLALRDLTKNLGSERPLYGLEGADFGDGANKISTIEQAAEQYVGALQAAQPRGPHILVGYSFGGLLALETGRRLAAQSGTEPRLMLIDTYPPIPKRKLSLLKYIWVRAWFHFNNLRGLKDVRRVTGYFGDLLRRVWTWLIRAIAIRSGVQASPPPTAPQIALAAYRPKPYPGRVVLFKANEREWWLEGDPMDAWKEFISGEMKIRLLPGEHNSLIKNPHAMELARQLLEELG